MGHYAAEMRSHCGLCYQEVCECPPPAQDKWLVDRDLTVMQVVDFDMKYSGMFMLRAKAVLFDTREEAMAHRVVVATKQAEQALVLANEANTKYSDLCDKRDALLNGTF